MGTVSKRQKQQRETVAKELMFPNRKADSLYSINVTLSDLTSLDRALPDTRAPSCSKHVYNISSLSPVTVIIPFFNEAPTMLLRAIHSILNRSPASLIEEIILGMFSVSLHFTFHLCYIIIFIMHIY